MKNEYLEKIKELTKEVRLPGVRKYLTEEINQANLKNLTYEDFLYSLLLKEHDLRLESGKKNRIRLAGFPYRKYLEDLSVSDLPADAQRRLKVLKSLDFIEQGQNVIMAGSPGTGKTHLAIALGIKACLSGYKVSFVTVPLLINQLKESRSQHILSRTESKFEKYDLVIVDELGYISFDREGSELLFTHLSLRAGRKSTIVTTNLSFDRWEEIFSDTVMTAAMIDRLTHKSYLLNMNGGSYRLKETKEWLAKQEEEKDDLN